MHIFSIDDCPGRFKHLSARPENPTRSPDILAPWRCFRSPGKDGKRHIIHMKIRCVILAVPDSPPRWKSPTPRLVCLRVPQHGRLATVVGRLLAEKQWSGKPFPKKKMFLRNSNLRAEPSSTSFSETPKSFGTSCRHPGGVFRCPPPRRRNTLVSVLIPTTTKSKTH